MISFFAKHPFISNQVLPNSSDRTIARLSSRIRAEEISDYLGGRVNPTEGFENDLCIHVKPRNLRNVRDGDVVDFLDAAYSNLLDQIKERPLIRVIAHTTHLYKYLKEQLVNEVVYIPHHHINWERATKDVKEFKVGGSIGSQTRSSAKMVKGITDALAKIGMEFKMCFNWTTREDAINFYKSIDFLVVYGTIGNNPYNYSAHPTKMINAASFGIPSFFTWHSGYEEFEDYYTPITDLDDLVEKVKSHKFDSARLISKAEEYHISNIAKLYKTL